MIKVTVSKNNNKIVKVLPVIQEDSLSIDYGQSSNENIDSIKFGQIKMLGLEPLAKVNIDSFFPVKKYDFMAKGSSRNGMDYVRFFRDNRKKRVPLRVVISNGKKVIFNRLMAIESFSIKSIDPCGDIYYSLELEQYRLVR